MLFVVVFVAAAAADAVVRVVVVVAVVVVPPPTNKKHKLFLQSERREAKVFASFFSGTYCCWLDKEAGFPKMFI